MSQPTEQALVTKRLKTTVYWLLGGSLISMFLYMVLGDWIAVGSFAVTSGLLGTAYWLILRQHNQSAVVLMNMAALCLVIVGSFRFFTLLSIATVTIISIVLVLPFVDSRRLLGICGLAWVVSIISIANRLRIDQFPWAEMPIRVSLNSVSILVVMGLLWQIHRQLTNSLQASERSNQALRASQQSLEQQVEQRTAALQKALQEVQAQADSQAVLAQQLAEQQTTIRSLSVPILPITQHSLVVPLIGDLDAERLGTLVEQILTNLKSQRTRHLILDVTGVPTLDRDAGHSLLKVSNAARLLGAKTTLIGVRPDVAEMLVSIGLDLRSIGSEKDLQSVVYGLVRHA
ncbi:MAG TPA: STAS domain-containing protein [Herpetosiphon sp.]|uniref:Anti-sigma-factor antagonist n=1 Tax=Herpetosiphon aurantiacus (strain ATCC 23779 / DSM 785 / 114-95) TaxID=316274 RepID=A9AUL0_HERA2|nr:STAS domain-containing protein [Herpetosiphon sp.]ABX04537.1 anti-sigma-factor antagonist [Herpetosiphon aurantiacus DSM 785]HBW50008.1 STAS domain-containing protein [Herpetosiphon sp.]